MKKPYESPKLSTLGDIRSLTRSGTPNQSYDGGSLFDFVGPNPPAPAT